MRIHAQEKYLTFDGLHQDAITFVDSIRAAYDDRDMPKVLNDFIFNIEVALQNSGWLDHDFNII